MSMKIEIIYSNRKTLALHVRDGEVFVRAPHQTPKPLIDSFVKEKEHWIMKHLDAYEPAGFTWEQPSLKIFGTTYPITYYASAKFEIQLEKDTVILRYPTSWSVDRLERTVLLHLKDLLDKQLDALVTHYALALGIQVPKYKIRKYKRIHGRCNRGGELAFNTYLFHENRRFIEYVVLHECAHILEFNHSAAFYAIIEKQMPDYKYVIKERKGR